MNIKYHFFGKDCIIDRELENRDNLKKVLKEKGIVSTNDLFVRQVHGRDVIIINQQDKVHDNQNLPRADALVTNLKNISISVVTADCAPILLFDKEQGIIGAAHAGWRGAKLGIISSVVSSMRNIGAKKIFAVLGPMIRQESYEVSQDFFDEFLDDDSSNKDFFERGLAFDKYMFDLPSYVKRKLHEEKIEEVEDKGIDTYKNKESFFSFRRSTHLGEKDCGRNISTIVMQ